MEAILKFPNNFETDHHMWIYSRNGVWQYSIYKDNGHRGWRHVYRADIEY